MTSKTNRNARSTARKNAARKPGGYGPRYSEDQLVEAIVLRAGGMNWKDVAAQIGVTSPGYLARMCRAGAREAGLKVAL